MRLIQAYSVSEFLEKDLQALFLISTLEKLKISASEKFAIFCYQKIIFEKVNKRIKSINQQSLDVSQVQRTIQTEHKLKKLFNKL